MPGSKGFETLSKKPKEKKKLDTSVSHTRVLVKDCGVYKFE